MVNIRALCLIENNLMLLIELLTCSLLFQLRKNLFTFELYLIKRYKKFKFILKILILVKN